MHPDAPDAAAAFDALVTEHYAELCNFGYRYVLSRAAEAADLVLLIRDVVCRALLTRLLGRGTAMTWSSECRADTSEPTPGGPA